MQTFVYVHMPKKITVLSMLALFIMGTECTLSKIGMTGRDFQEHIHMS